MFKNLEPTEENKYVKYELKCKKFQKMGGYGNLPESFPASFPER